MKITLKQLESLIEQKIRSILIEGTTPQFKKLIQRAKQLRIDTIKELEELIGDEFDDTKNPITGADFEVAKKILRLKENILKEINVKEIDIDSIKPDQKDFDRADGLEFQGSTFHGNGSPWTSTATAMAKLIKDPIKLVRRAKAVVHRWGIRDYIAVNGGARGQRIEKKENVWIPFKDALVKMGFSNDQINIISKYKK